jgi:hypothetical protein
LNPDPVPDLKIKVLDLDPCLDPELEVSDPNFDPYNDPGTDPVLEVSNPGLDPEHLVPDPALGLFWHCKGHFLKIGFFDF